MTIVAVVGVSAAMVLISVVTYLRRQPLRRRVARRAARSILYRADLSHRAVKHDIFTHVALGDALTVIRKVKRDRHRGHGQAPSEVGTIRDLTPPKAD